MSEENAILEILLRCRQDCQDVFLRRWEMGGGYLTVRALPYLAHSCYHFILAQKFYPSQEGILGFLVGKGKRKKANPNIEFVSPYPLEDCVWQLQNFPGVGEWFPVKTRVKLTQVDEETWAFRITKSYFSLGFLDPGSSSQSRSQRNVGLGYPKVLAEGQLRVTPSNATLVIGTVSAKRTLSITSFILACVFIAILVSGILAIFPVFNATPLTAIITGCGFFDATPYHQPLWLA